jgi:histidyl-tRNA synthetase
VKLPFKRYAIGTVYRDGPIKLGRYREFTQCDGDIVGANTAIADAQCIDLGLAAFHQLGIPVTVEVNHMGLLKRILAHDGCPEDKLVTAILIIDKLKKIGETAVLKELEDANVPTASARKLIAITQLATNDERLRAIIDAYGEQEDTIRVRDVLALVDDERAIFLPSLSRGLSYYTGIVYEYFITDSHITSSCASGGRYDHMIGGFLEREADFPAVGVSFGLEPIIEHLKLAETARQQSVVRAFIIPIKTVSESQRLAKALRAAGINTDIDLLGRGPSKNMEYANEQGIPFAVIVGRKELEAGVVRLKDMRTGDERLLSQEDLIARLQ